MRSIREQRPLRPRSARTMSGNGASNTLSSQRSGRRGPLLGGTWFGVRHRRSDPGAPALVGDRLRATWGQAPAVPGPGLAPASPEPAEEPEPAPAPTRAGALVVARSLAGTGITASRISRPCTWRSLPAVAALLARTRVIRRACVAGGACVAAVATIARLA